jgi:hypothetical protein
MACACVLPQILLTLPYMHTAPRFGASFTFAKVHDGSRLVFANRLVEERLHALTSSSLRTGSCESDMRGVGKHVCSEVVHVCKARFVLRTVSLENCGILDERRGGQLKECFKNTSRASCLYYCIVAW